MEKFSTHGGLKTYDYLGATVNCWYVYKAWEHCSSWEEAWSRHCCKFYSQYVINCIFKSPLFSFLGCLGVATIGGLSEILIHLELCSKKLGFLFWCISYLFNWSTSFPSLSLRLHYLWRLFSFCANIMFGLCLLFSALWSFAHRTIFEFPDKVSLG